MADTVCADEHAIAGSPLSLSVESLETFYELDDIKVALRESGRAMTLSLPLVYQQLLLPCTLATATQRRCNPFGPECRPCPLTPETVFAGCCIAQTRPGHNLSGEFGGGLPLGRLLLPAGRHTLSLVGFNDGFVSSAGHVGGLILKNSWCDGIYPPEEHQKEHGARLRGDQPAPRATSGGGSHSLGYYMGRVSAFAEGEICPNVHSPSSWYACASLEACTIELAAISARATRKVLRLQCFEDGTRSPHVRGVCTAGETFFLRNATAFGAGLSVSCLVRAAGGPDLCLPPLPPEHLALVFAPEPEEIRQKDPDQRGFYILPYKVFRDVAAHVGSPRATDLGIRWDEASFAGGPEKRKRKGKDYASLARDTLEQRQSVFYGPFPDLDKPL